jgi:hypothetical protein
MRFAGTCLLSLALLTGCSTTSTITRVNGPTIEGHIVGGDAENVYVGPKDAPEAIPRSEITDIDYPGDGATVVGSILGAYGIANIAVGLPHCNANGPAFCTGVFAPLGVGIGMVLWGIGTHASAVSAARTPPHESGARLFVMPVVGTDKGGPSGAAVVGTF